MTTEATITEVRSTEVMASPGSSRASGTDRRAQTATTNAREASLRPFGKPSRVWWLTILGLSLVMLAGIAGWVLQLQGGMGVAGHSDQAFWAIYIADVVTFIGVSYGGAVVSAILRLTGATWRAPLTRLAEGTAVVTVLIGAALIIPHIGNPIRLWELVTRPNLSAPVFWDFVVLMTYTFGSIVFFALPLVPDMAVLGQELIASPARPASCCLSPSWAWSGWVRPITQKPQRRRVPRCRVPRCRVPRCRVPRCRVPRCRVRGCRVRGCRVRG